MKKTFFLITALMLAFVLQSNAQTRGANKSTAFAVKANTHKKKPIPHSVTRKQGPKKSVATRPRRLK